MKGKVMAMIVSGIMACSMFSAPVYAAENLYGKHPEKTIIFNEDTSDIVWANSKTGVNMQNLTSWADKMASANVGAVFMCTQSQKSNFAGNVFETQWEGYKEGDDGTSVATFGMKDAHKNGVDFNEIRIQLLREREISPWITVRMNDIHDGTASVSASTFKLKHSYKIGNKSTGQDIYCMDYHIPEVRNYFFAGIRDRIERFDVDGIELDWQRECYRILDADYREETRVAINQMVRDIRKMLDFWEMERGHEIMLAVRVPCSVAAAEGAALDAETWSREKLVDIVTVAPRWASLDTDMDVEGWIKAVKTDTGNTDIQVGAGLDVLYRANPGDDAKSNGIETARGASYSYLSRGADFMYLFNHMQYTKMSYHDTDWIPMMQQINSMDNMKGKVRRYAVTIHDKWGVSEEIVYALPKVFGTGDVPSFDIHVGNISEIKNDENYYVILGAHQNYGGTGVGIIDAAGDCTVKVNGIECTYAGKANDLREPTPSVGGVKIDLVKYTVPASAMQDGYNTVTVQTADGVTRELRWVEIYAEPKN